VEQSPDNLTIF